MTDPLRALADALESRNYAHNYVLNWAQLLGVITDAQQRLSAAAPDGERYAHANQCWSFHIVGETAYRCQLTAGHGGDHQHPAVAPTSAGQPPARVEGLSEDARGMFTCDVCGLDTPHGHSDEDVEQERFARPAFHSATDWSGNYSDGERFVENAKFQRIGTGPSATYPPDTRRKWHWFLTGWNANKAHLRQHIASLEQQLSAVRGECERLQAIYDAAEQHVKILRKQRDEYGGHVEGWQKLFNALYAASGKTMLDSGESNINCALDEIKHIYAERDSLRAQLSSQSAALAAAQGNARRLGEELERRNLYGMACTCSTGIDTARGVVEYKRCSRCERLAALSASAAEPGVQNG